MTTTSFTCSVQRVVAQARPIPHFTSHVLLLSRAGATTTTRFSVEEWDSSGVNVLKC
jgi:hypothetical protein